MTSIIKPKQFIRYEGPEKLTIKTDGKLLKNTMLNMLSNAIKYSREDGEIIVTLEDLYKGVRISVQDFGVGRSEEHTSEPSHVRISYAVFCLKKKNDKYEFGTERQ